MDLRRLDVIIIMFINYSLLGMSWLREVSKGGAGFYYESSSASASISCFMFRRW